MRIAGHLIGVPAQAPRQAQKRFGDKTVTPTRSALCLAGALALCIASAAHAQTFPSRPITLVAPFPAGSVTDTVTRVVAQAMQENLGQSVIVDNKAGAQGT